LSNASAALEALVAEAKDRNLHDGARIQVITALGKWATAEVREPLIALLEEPNPSIRAAAASGLGWPGNGPAVAALRDRVLDAGEEGPVREAAVGALVRIGDPLARGMILDASWDAHRDVREAALRGLVDGPLQSPIDKLELAGRAAQDEELSLAFRADAIRALTATGDKAAIPILVEILETGPRFKIASPRPDAGRRELLAVQLQQIGDVRAWAAAGLGELSDCAAAPKLVKATEDPDDFFLRFVAAEALIRCRTGQALPAFLNLLRDPASEVRTVAVFGIGMLGDASNVDVVAALLNDDIISVRLGAAEALAMIGGDAACRELRTAHEQEISPPVRRALAAALGRLGCP
jgi:HEAT repeat protein